MTLEMLFAQGSQGRAFLLMMLCGAGAAGLLQATGRLQRMSRSAGLAADGLCAALVTLALGQTVLWTGQLRGYALLGLTIGALLYIGGVTPLVRWVQRRAHRRDEK